MQKTVSKHLQYNLHCKIFDEKNLVVEKEKQFFSVQVVAEEDFVDFDSLHASNNIDNVPKYNTEEVVDGGASKAIEALNDGKNIDKILAVVARDSSVGYYKIQTGFITPDKGLPKIPYDLKTDKDKSNDEDQDIDD